MKKTLVLLLCVALMLSVAVGCSSDTGSSSSSSSSSSSTQAEGFKLKGTVEFVVPYSPGGGSDLYARIAADIIQQNGWVDQAIMVVNKPGGGGTVGDSYTASKKGSNETITTYVSGQVTSQLMNNTPVTFRELTPICNLAMDEYTIGVLKSSPYQTIEEFLEAAKNNPGTITVGGSGKGTEDELVTGLMEKVIGIDLEYVSFNSSSEVLSAMLGGHIDAGIYNPNEILSQYQAGEVTLLAAFGPERIALFPDVRTFTEIGYPDVVFQQFRGIAGAPGMAPEAVQFWADVFKKVIETDRWKTEYLDKNGLTSKYMAGDEFVQFLTKEEAKYRDILVSIGAIQ